jgi:hypothetical protein
MAWQKLQSITFLSFVFKTFLGQKEKGYDI